MKNFKTRFEQAFLRLNENRQHFGFRKDVAPILACSIMFGIAQAIAGWSGHGMSFAWMQWLRPGFPAMLISGSIGFVGSFVFLGLVYWFLTRASRLRVAVIAAPTAVLSYLLVRCYGSGSLVDCLIFFRRLIPSLMFLGFLTFCMWFAKRKLGGDTRMDLTEKR